MSDRAKHKVFTRAMRGLGPGEAVEIPKTTVRNLPGSYEQTMLGVPSSLAVPGGRRQFRGPWNRHVVETRDSWVAHRDTADPREDPIGHLAVDAPEIGAGLLVGAGAGYLWGRARYERALALGVDQKTAAVDAVLEALLAGTAGFVAGYGTVRFLKWILSE